ncbi:MAG: DUF1492 domain-containing protein [Clostridia bacterium]|nr:DUF1492 domain-containing protein [Clostridia bacterium]
MITQDWLNGYRFYKQVVETLQLRLSAALSDSIRITSRPKDVAVQSSRGNSTEDRNIQYISKTEAISNQITEYRGYMAEIESAVNSVSNPKYRLLLRLRYIDGESWESVAEVMGMSEKWVREDLNFRAIRELERCTKKQSG